MVSTSANAIAQHRDIPADGWFPVATYGEHPSPDRAYTQVFTRAEADETVRTWNSIPAKAFRVMKNLRHRLKPALTIPIVEWDHIDTDPTDWSKLETLGEASDVRATANALEVYVTWNQANMAKRAAGPLYPSIIWWHNPPDAERKVYPSHLESIALVPNPNISSVPAWTKNASPNDDAQSTANIKQMNEEQLKALRIALNLPADTDPQKVIDTARSAYQLSTSNATALQTANAAKQTLETQLSTANGNVTTLTTERDQLKDQNSQLSTVNSIVVEGVLDLFEAAGKFTPAQRPDMKAKFTSATANSAAAIITELKNKKPEINTKTIELNGSRVDLSTANARQAAFETAIAQRMDKDKCDRGTAFDRVMEDPAFKQLVEAMKPKQAAA